MEAAAGGVEIDHTFGGSHPGEMHERFYCPQPDILHVDTSVTLTGKGTVAYRQVYRKKGS